MHEFEKLGAFYLGRRYDLQASQPTDELLLYDSKDLCTHAVCVGMTGSGKTGLCLALLEEAAIDGIPALIIDPKGDLGNLLLTFPQLRPEDFLPWIDPADAARAGQSPEEFATAIAERWRKGLAEWGQDGQRIQRFRDAADVAIYTPGSTAGLPLTVLRSFHVPPPAVLQDAEAFREAIGTTAASLLGLLGIEADPLRSREHILIATILDRTWRSGIDLDMPGLVRAIQSPPFDKLGLVDLETAYPVKERFELAMLLNNLVASPGYAAWLEGEPLDIQKLLYTAEGKPRLSILSIAHLSDQERMFFVTILLNEVIAWMRTQSGTSSLRALLYMDEVFGYFPPTANPPSKTPMLTLMKQARAFGLGVVLATQNPVDLDYKGLSNAGTWLLGRLQTERDKQRVLDGLEGASAAAGAAFDRATMERTLSGLGNRVFLMNNVHEDEPVVFQTRWALSYLRGPLTRDQISRLMADRKATDGASPATDAPSSQTQAITAGSEPQTAKVVTPPVASSSVGGPPPVLPPDVPQWFLPRRASLPTGSVLLYRPAVLGRARLRFTDSKADVDTWQQVALLLPADEDRAANDWDRAEEVDADSVQLDAAGESTALFAALPADLARAKPYTKLSTGLKNYLYRERRLTLLCCPLLKQYSRPGESESDFRVRLAHVAREERDRAVEKLRQKYAPKIATLQDRIRRAQNKVEQEKASVSQQTIATAVSIGTTLLGALFGRKLTSTANVTRAGTSVRAAGRVARKRQDVAEAEESVELLQQRLTDLEAEFESEAEQLQAELHAERLPIEKVEIAPRKSDIEIQQVALIWQPWIVRTDGRQEKGV